MRQNNVHVIRLSVGGVGGTGQLFLVEVIKAQVNSPWSKASSVVLQHRLGLLQCWIVAITIPTDSYNSLLSML